MSAEPTLAAQLREMIVPPACVDLIEQASVRLDELERELFIEREASKAEHYAVEQLERQLAKVQYWRDRHCRESEQHAQRSGDNWKAWKAAERQLATVAQAERERCAFIIETLDLTMEQHKYPSPEERHLIAVVEAGCRDAFAQAVRALERDEVKS
jgi:hypothetical protein